MTQQTFNPYPDLGTQFSNGLDYIVNPFNWINPPGPIYVPPTLEDIIHAIIKYIDEELGYFASPMSIPVSIELKSVVYTAINNFINKPCTSMYGGGQLPFVAMITCPSLINNYTVDSLDDHIHDIEDNITKACLTTAQQQPLLIATMIGKTAYDYLLAEINLGESSSWYSYFSTSKVSAIANLPFWVQASMQGSLIGNRTTMRGMIAPTVDIVTIEIVSALIAALIVTTGKVIFKWIPQIVPIQPSIIGSAPVKSPHVMPAGPNQVVWGNSINDNTPISSNRLRIDYADDGRCNVNFTVCQDGYCWQEDREGKAGYYPGTNNRFCHVPGLGIYNRDNETIG